MSAQSTTPVARDAAGAHSEAGVLGPDRLGAFTLTGAAYVSSLVGSQLATLGLSVWVFQQMGSVAACGEIAVAGMAPAIVLAPIAGVLVDRSPRAAMFFGYAGAALCSAALATLFVLEAITFPRLLALVAFGSVFKSVQFPSLSALTQRLVAPARLGQANGAVQLASAIAQVVGPMASAALVAACGVWGVVAGEAVALGVSTISVTFVRVPPMAMSGNAPEARLRVVGRVGEGWRFIRQRPALFLLLAVVAVANFNVGAAQVLVTPLVLGFADVAVLGRALSVGGVGMVFAGVLLVFWAGPQGRLYAVIGAALCQSVSIFLMGALRPSQALVAGCAFGVLFAMPVLGACSQVIWQRAVPLHLQGSVAGIRFMATQGLLPIAQLAVGPLAERVVEPLVASAGGRMGALLSFHPTRGIAGLLVVLGAVSALVTVAAAVSRPFHRFESESPGSTSALPGSVRPT